MKRPILLLSLFILSFAVSAQDKVIGKVLELSLRPTGKTVNPDMYGVFFEDINFGADGGLYAEKVKNRSFDFPYPLMGWIPFGDVTVHNEDACFRNNPNYIRIVNDGRLLRAGIDNEGFRGIGLVKDEEYRFSAYVRTPCDSTMTLSVELPGHDGYNGYKSFDFSVSGRDWHKINFIISSPLTDAHAHLRICLKSLGSVDMDHISFFPVKTWKGRENGLRLDLAQALADLHPGVLRFPGGCVIEGNSLETRYQWKKTVGPVEERVLNENRWNYTFKHRAFPDYFQSCGLGFFEFFQFAEEIGAAPLPVISCGLSCQYESDELVPMDELGPYIQDALDLIEFANGPVTSTWGKVRAEMGHPAPFGLKYLGIGNEQWGHVYVERLEAFIDAIRAKYPEIQIVGTSGPESDGEKFDYLWPEMRRLGADLVDEHYYKSPDWFFSSAHRYDNYDRKGPKVFAGEYASHDEDNDCANNFKAALSEAAFMTGLERNADVVRLATYAPLFAHAEAWQWRPDMIWFDNLRCSKTPSYYVQQMYAGNKGTDVLDLLCGGEPLAGQNGLYASAVRDGNKLIVKIVNAGLKAQRFTVNVQDAAELRPVSISCTTLHHDDLSAVNSLEAEKIHPVEISEGKISGNKLKLNIAAQSFNVYTVTLK